MGQGVVFTVLGARGSWPVSRADMLTYGGRTTSFMMTWEGRHTAFVDAGTGLASVDDLVVDDADHYDILVTHFHLDHLQGLQFFRPLYRPGTSFTFHGHAPEGMSLEDAIGGVSQSPWFPLPLDATQSNKTFVPIDGPLDLGPMKITSTRLNHPQGVTGYRIEGPDRTVVIATDHEAGDAAADSRLIELATGADYLIHDAQYTPEEYTELYAGWGHSTWEDAVAAAERAGVGTLVLTSHDPSHNDADIDAILAAARERFPETHAAFEGMQIPM